MWYFESDAIEYLGRTIEHNVYGDNDITVENCDCKFKTVEDAMNFIEQLEIWLEEQNMNELYINDSIIYFKTNAKNYDKAMDEFIEACVKADIDITIENACLRDENGDEVDE